VFDVKQSPWEVTEVDGVERGEGISLSLAAELIDIMEDDTDVDALSDASASAAWRWGAHDAATPGGCDRSKTYPSEEALSSTESEKQDARGSRAVLAVRADCTQEGF
jgi:hypothetical protein